MTTPSYVLAGRAITKSFGATSVLKGFDLSVGKGEVHAFLGGNGAGKSTLIKIISGQHQRDGGSLSFDGQEIDSTRGQHIAAGAIAVVNQELALLPHLTVAENIALPRFRRAAQRYDHKLAQRMCIEALSLIDRQFAHEAVNRLVAELTLHERQLVEIARSLGTGARLLLLDEPTANLTAAETEKLFAVIRRLVADTGLAVLFVSHRMQEIRKIADVCTIIRDGKTAVDRVRLDEITDQQILECMGQCNVGEASGPEGQDPATPKRRRFDPAASAPAGSLTIASGGVRLPLRPGEIIGLAGAPTGPTALINQLAGLDAHGRWDIRRDDQPVRHAHPAAAVRDGIGLISGDRANKGILGTLPILDNLLASSRIVERVSLLRAEELQRADQLLKALNIRAGSLWDLPGTLSGGTQQKLLVARWLLLNPRILVLEEPTRGVDLRTKREIYALIREMAARGTTVLWWATEYVELVELCDTVLAFDLEGQPTRILPHDEIDEASLASATGMAA